MRGFSDDRAVILGQYIIDTGATVRATAKVFKISKSTVHKDVTERLYNINKSLYDRVDAVLQKNKSERHIRGGLATRKKYKGE
ncbi:MAG: sporulation transcriptional regulator SpoIIID [Clostridia bacterium]|nr:sporulation transcriptional regulator SpoIIID [Clostridia bacterium]